MEEKTKTIYNNNKTLMMDTTTTTTTNVDHRDGNALGGLFQNIIVDLRVNSEFFIFLP